MTVKCDVNCAFRDQEFCTKELLYITPQGLCGAWFNKGGMRIPLDETDKKIDLKIEEV